MKLRTSPTFVFLYALFVAASTARAQEYGFRFYTSAPGFGGELFFNAPSGNGPADQVLYGNSFITTPDGTFTESLSFAGGPFPINPPPTVWSPSGITTLNLSLYESLNSQLYSWTATLTSISDSPVSAIPLVISDSPMAAIPSDPSASGTWVYIGTVPEPSSMLLTALGVTAMLIWPIRHNQNRLNGHASKKELFPGRQ